jgi:hypothetical protein
MRGSRDGNYPWPEREPWEADPRPPTSIPPDSQRAVPSIRPSYDDTPTQRYAGQPGGSQQWTRAGLEDLPTQELVAIPLLGREPSGGGRLPTFLRPPTVWFTGIAAGALIMVVVLVLLSLPAPARTTTPTKTAGTITVRPTAEPTATAVVLPAFALPLFQDWRVAYLAADGVVHVTSLDGQTDLAGPALQLNLANTTNSTVAPGIGPTYQSYTSMTVSPNGQYLAYINQPPQQFEAGIAPPTGDLVLSRLAAHPGVNVGWTTLDIPGQVTDVGGWSPDSSAVAFSATGNNATGIYIETPPAGKPRLIPGFENNGALANSHIVGWIDDSHLLLLVSGNGWALPPLPKAAPTSAPTPSPTLGGTPAAMMPLPVAQSDAPLRDRSALSAPISSPRSSNQPQFLATMDITTGIGYSIADVPAGSQLALSPDGTHVVVQNSCVVGCIASSLITELIDTHTGAVHSLPTSDAVIAPTGRFVWQPGANAFAATIATPPQQPNQWKVALVDAQHDAAHIVRAGAFAIGWSPDGQALVLGDAATIGYGGTKVWLVTPASAGASVTLPQPMVAFIGFVRTA